MRRWIMLYRFLFFISCLFSFSCSLSSEATIDRQKVLSAIPELEKLIHSGMQISSVPGVSVVIVFQNEILYVNGFGVREVGKPEKVTPDTIFQIASASKPVATTCLAALVSQKKLDWDSKISDLDPQFRLSDPWITSQLTVRDLLSHRS